MKRAICAAIVCLSFSAAAHADVLETFQISGTDLFSPVSDDEHFSSGDISGLITVDVTTGIVFTGDVGVASAPPTEWSSRSGATFSFSANALSAAYPQPVGPYLTLYIAPYNDASSLQDFIGGQITGGTANLNIGISCELDNCPTMIAADFVGTITEVTPIPPAAALFATGLVVALGLLAWRSHRCARI